MAIMYLIPFIVWFIAIEVLYHTIFTVYYFNLGKGCLSEVVASFAIAFILTCLPISIGMLLLLSLFLLDWWQAISRKILVLWLFA